MFSYIGICDFMNGEQSLRSANLFQTLCITRGLTHYKIMVGTMMSLKTMTGQPSKWSAAWAKNEDVAQIFIDHPSVFNTLHYADYDCNTSTSHLIEAAEWGGPNLHALQLDMVWPPDVIIKGLKRRFPHLKIILQVNANAMALMQDSPVQVAQQLQKYGKCVDYALLDKSHGRGVGMDAKVLLEFARVICEQLPDMRLAVAGGLGPKTMNLAEPIVKEFPNVSIDAQGKLRPSGNALDPIDWMMADEYLERAVRLMAYKRLS